jgi:hypothetical protein
MLVVSLYHKSKYNKFLKLVNASAWIELILYLCLKLMAVVEASKSYWLKTLAASTPSKLWAYNAWNAVDNKNNKRIIFILFSN